MWRPDELVIDLACGAELTVRVIVDPANCRAHDGQCPTADDIAGLIWAHVHVVEIEAPRE
jgi:hypothetical protein